MNEHERNELEPLERSVRGLFEATRHDLPSAAESRLLAYAEAIPVAAGRRSMWLRFAGALVAGAAAVALVIAVWPGGTPAPDRARTAHPSMVAPDAVDSHGAGDLALAAQELTMDPDEWFAEPVEGGLWVANEWEEMASLDLFYGPGPGDDEEAWEQAYAALLDDMGR